MSSLKETLEKDKERLKREDRSKVLRTEKEQKAYMNKKAKELAKGLSKKASRK